MQFWIEIIFEIQNYSQTNHKLFYYYQFVIFLVKFPNTKEIQTKQGFL